MDVITLISSVASSLGISIAAAYWLSKQLITHKLAKDLEAYKVSWQKELEKEKSGWQKSIEEAKAGWQRELEKDKTAWQGEIHKEVEVFLGETSAEREYTLEARKRLYHAIGPLKFQLLLACRDASARVENYGSDLGYEMTMNGYYGRSTLYRLLRPVAIAELIERQITYTDFSVDPTGIELLRFKKAAYMSFTDGDVILNHPDADWTNEREHVFSGTLSRLANSLVILDQDVSNKERPMHFHEFEPLIRDHSKRSEFSPLTRILEDFEVEKKPIFWIRLVCFGYICNEYLGYAGGAIGFEKRRFDLDKLLLASQNDYTLSKIDRYKDVFQSLLKMSL